MDSKEYAKECQDIKEDIKKKNDQLNDINAKIAEYAMIKYSHHMKELELRIVDLENQLKKKEEDNI